MNNLHLRDGKIAFRWKRWRNKKRQEVSYCLMVLFSGAVLFGAGGMALAGPTGGQVTSGTGTINQAGTTTTIDQTSSVLNINWQTFSTAPNETVNFVQPGSTSLAINRVVGGVPSYLQGALNANGRVFILNSAGITFAGTSRVNVGALLATTAMSVNGNVGGLATYSAPSGSGGSVINQGSITVSNGGFAILAAPYVQNTGFIKADLGTVALAGTNSFTLDLRGDGLINFVVPPGAAAQIAADGQKVGVDNSGTLQARSGQVIISANVATQVVNAVVNMSGVVDADALSGNSKGGSVLVTSTGDINLGGTITAQGNGTGAGGSIVTKAAGLDNVESGANLLAAGGAAGKGGFIDVSGHNVKLDGNIDPGKGGQLLLDPANITVITSAGANSQSASTVNETWLANELQHGVFINLQATHDIIFKGHNEATFVLWGGSGNLLANAGSNIITSDVGNYEIRTGNGNVTLTAGHDILGNNLSIVSGWGTDVATNPVGSAFHYNNVTQAGDIILKAGNDISLDNVKVITKSTDGTDHALFSANAGVDLSIAGNVDVEATNSGHNAVAHATANLVAETIEVGGNIDVLASVHNASGNIASAVANLQVTTVAQPLNSAQLGSIFSNVPAVNHLFNSHTVNLNGAVTVEANAFADNRFVADVHAVAEADITGSHIAVNGPARVTAYASGDGDVVTANAQLVAELGHGSFTSNFSANGVSFSVDGRVNVGAQDVRFNNTITVTAVANDIAISGANANAFVHLAGQSVDVAGLVTVTANARGSNDSADAHARLLIDFADASATINIFNTPGNSNALASAVQEFGNAIAGHFFGLDFGLNHIASELSNADIGTRDSVLFSNHHANSAVNYIAIDGHGHIGGTDVHLDNGIFVQALANGYSIDHNFAAPAHANATATVAAEFINFGGPVTVNAAAFGGSIIHSVTADAKLLTDKASLSIDAHVAYRYTIDGSPSYFADRGTAFQLNAHVGGDQVAFRDAFNVTALATGHEQTGKVSADASVHLVAGVSSNSDTDDGQTVLVNNTTPGVFVNEPAIVRATATGHGSNAANGVGSVHADAHLLVDALDVTIATSHGIDPVVGRIIIGDRTVGGSTIASLTGLGGFNNVTFAPTIDFTYGIDVEAHAHGNFVNGSVTAKADAKLYGREIDISSDTTGQVHVRASAEESYGTKDGGIHASAEFVAAGSAFHVTGTASYLINAEVHYNGDITIGAQEVDIGSNISVTAFADPKSGNGVVTANAFVHLAASSVVVDGNITDLATALGAGHEANAEARLLVDFADVQLNASFTYSGHSDGALADVLNSAAGFVSYAAFRLFDANGQNLGLADLACLTRIFSSYGDFGAHLSVDAHVGGLHDSLQGVDVEANADARQFSANGDFVGDGSAHALALATIAGESIEIHGPVKVLANAHGGSVDGFGSVTAEARLLTDFIGLEANLDFPSYGTRNNHHAVPSYDLLTLKLDAHIGGGFVSFGNGFSVDAHASGENIFKVTADATAHLVAGDFFALNNVATVLVSSHSGENIVVNGPANVHATADGFGVFFDNAHAHLLADAVDVKDSGSYGGFSYQENFARVVLGGAFIPGSGIDAVFSVNNAPDVVIEANMLFENGIDVHAQADGFDASYIGAVASAELYGHQINVEGPALVGASADHFGGSARGVRAIANLTVAADASTAFSFANDVASHNDLRSSHNRLLGNGASINFGSSINVQANAFGGQLHNDETGAQADANVRLAAEDRIYVGGPVSVMASATGHGTYEGSGVRAEARFEAFGSERSSSNNSSHSHNRTFVTEGAGSIFLDPNLTVTANAHGHDVGSVEASATAFLAASYIRVDGDVAIMGSAKGSYDDEIRAEAELTAEGGSSFNSSNNTRNYERSGAEFINFLHDVDVQAQATGNQIDSRIEASANVLLVADNILMQGDVTVTASANGFNVERIFASANLIAEGSSFSFGNGVSSYRGHFAPVNDSISSITFLDEIDVQAKASGHSVGSSIEASADAKLFGRFIQVSGEATVKATAENSGSYDDSAVGRVKSLAKLVAAEGSFSFVFEDGRDSYHFTTPAFSIDFKSEIDVEALTKGGTIDGVASANAFVHLAGFDITVADDITVLANATGHGSGNTGDFRGSSVLAKSRLIVDGGSYGSQTSYHSHSYQAYFGADNINIGGAIDVEAKASGGQMRDSIAASAYVHLLADPILVSGPITVKATAVNVGTNTQEVDDVGANAQFITGSYIASNFFDHGQDFFRTVDGEDASVTLAGNLDVEARANGGNLGSYAQARSLVILAGDDVTVSGNIDVKASATGHGFSYTTVDNAHRHHTADGVFGEASLFVVGSMGSEIFDSGRARDQFFADNASSATLKGNVDVATKVAGQQISGSVDGSAEFSITAVHINLDARVGVTASANGTSVDGFVEARAHGSLESSRDLGFVNVKGPITVLASAHGNNSNFDSFGRTVEASAGLDVDGTSMQLRTINVTANAAGIHFEDVEAFAHANLGDSSYSYRGALTVRGNINVNANAVGSSVDGVVEAFGGVGLFADRIVVDGNINAAGLARGNGAHSVDGSAQISGEGGTISINGAVKALGRADVSNTFDGFGATYTRAEADVGLHAFHNLTVFASGTHVNAITVTAVADSQHEARHAWAGAFLHDTAASVDSYHGTGNLLIHGNITDQAIAFGTGPSNTALAFQHQRGSNVEIIGNVRSLAHADASYNDRAEAGVSMDADIHDTSESHHGLILIIGDAPIASANAGTAHARRQAAFSTEQSAHGLNGSYAFADIDIEGSEAIVVTPTTDQQLRLLTLETLIPNPPWASSSLSEIVLTMQGHKCGVLGGAGNPNQRSDACEKRSIHISETDTLP